MCTPGLMLCRGGNPGSEQMGTPSGVRGCTSGRKAGTSALTPCHPAFPSPSESLNFAHLS